MARGLGLGQPPKECLGAVLHRGLERAPAEEVQDLAQAAVTMAGVVVMVMIVAVMIVAVIIVMVMIVMIVIGVVIPVDQDIHLGGPQPRAVHRASPAVPGERDLGQLLAQDVQRQAQVHERAEQSRLMRRRRSRSRRAGHSAPRSLSETNRPAFTTTWSRTSMP